MSNSLSTRQYLPLNYGQILKEGALCYIMGTYRNLEQGAAVLTDATVAYEDAGNRIHANLFPHLTCTVTGIERAEPDTVIRVVAEMKLSRTGIPRYTGVLYGAMEPVFELDPASRIDRRRAAAVSPF